MGNSLAIRVLRRQSKNGAPLLADEECAVGTSQRHTSKATEYICTHVLYLLGKTQETPEEHV